jgi:hypothetical protein
MQSPARRSADASVARDKRRAQRRQPVTRIEFIERMAKTIVSPYAPRNCLGDG